MSSSSVKKHLDISYKDRRFLRKCSEGPPQSVSVLPNENASGFMTKSLKQDVQDIFYSPEFKMG